MRDGSRAPPGATSQDTYTATRSPQAGWVPTLGLSFQYDNTDAALVQLATKRREAPSGEEQGTPMVKQLVDNLGASRISSLVASASQMKVWAPRSGGRQSCDNTPTLERTQPQNWRRPNKIYRRQTK